MNEWHGFIYAHKHTFKYQVETIADELMNL